MAKKPKMRKRYTAEQRATILAAAQKDHLTAKDVHKRFGVSAVTYYSWRKKRGGGRRPRRAGAPTRGRQGLLGSKVQSEVQARIRSLLPKLVEAEVKRYLDVAFGSGGRRRQ